MHSLISSVITPSRTRTNCSASSSTQCKILGFKKPILFLILCGLTSGCSTTQITPTAGQRVIYANGQATVCSVEKASFVAIQPLGKDGDGRLVYRVAVYNAGRTPFNFGPENIRVTDGTGKSVHLFTRAEVERHARVRATWLAVAAGMNAASQSYAAAQPARSYYSGTFNANSNYSTYNQYGRPVGTLNGYSNGAFSGSASTYDPARAALAQQAIQINTAAQFQSINQQLSAELTNASSVLGTTTVFPGRWCTGIILTQRTSQPNFLLDVYGAQHRAVFEVR
jgi:hypothetical protein